MKETAKLYVQGVKKKFHNYFAAWQPNQELRLGDVGFLNNKYFFTQYTTLKDLGVTFSTRPDSSPTPIDFVSQSGVSLNFKAKGETNDQLPNIPKGKVGLGFDFSSQGGFVIKAQESFEPVIENMVEVQEQVLKLWNDGKWDSKWVIITKLVQTPYATILVANSRDSHIELAAEADISLAQADLGKAGLEFSVRSQKGDVLKFIGAQNISPYFMLAKVKKKLFGSAEVVMPLYKFGLGGMPGGEGFEVNTTDKKELLYLDLVTDQDLSD